MKIPPPGDYTAKLNGRIVIYEADSGALCAAVPCCISRGEHAGFTTKANVTVIKKDGSPVEAQLDNLKAAFGWDGLDPFTLSDNDYEGLEFSLAQCRNEEYEGRVQFKAGFLNPLGGGMKMPEPADRKSVLAKYGAKFRALAGNPAKPSATTPKPLDPISTADECWQLFQKENIKLDFAAQTELWFEAIKEKFGADEASAVTPQQWGGWKGKLADDVPFDFPSVPAASPADSPEEIFWRNLEIILSENAKYGDYLRFIGWLKTGQHIREITKIQAEKIIGNPVAFKRTADAWIAGGRKAP